MYAAPFVCLAHNKFEEGVEDPLFVYANRAALRLFEGSWDEIVGMPSRLSADTSAQEVRGLGVGLFQLWGWGWSSAGTVSFRGGEQLSATVLSLPVNPDKAQHRPTNQQERNKLLEQAAGSGAIKNYEGWRQSLKGKRFKIKGVNLFNVTEITGGRGGASKGGGALAFWPGSGELGRLRGCSVADAAPRALAVHHPHHPAPTESAGDLYGQAVVFDQYEEEVSLCV